MSERNELNAEQSLGWQGGLLAGVAIGDLPELMERLHFRVVAAYGLGMSVRREGSRVTCALPGGVPALVFEHAGDEVGEHAAARWWRMGGWLVRGGGGGRFGLGLEELGGQTRAWVRVERFPGVFLAPGVPRAVGVVYETFHAHVSRRYLELLRAQLAR
jgi:hypothetical protein